MEPGIPTKLFVPLMMTPALRPGFDDMFNRRQRWVNVYGRLKPGFTVDRAKAGIDDLRSAPRKERQAFAVHLLMKKR